MRAYSKKIFVAALVCGVDTRKGRTVFIRRKNMKATGWDLMKLAQTLDGEFCLSDFTPEELDEMLGLLDENMTPEEVRRTYFEYYDDVKDRTLEKHKWSD